MTNDSQELAELVSTIEAQEARLVFRRFTFDDAWRLGHALAERAIADRAPVAVDIRLGDQQLFHVALAGSTADNDDWIDRKCRVVRRFGVSSYLFGRRLAAAGKTLAEATLLDPAVYAAHGGAFPITIIDVGVVGTVAVSGLPQAQDHQLIVDVLGEFLFPTKNS